MEYPLNLLDDDSVALLRRLIADYKNGKLNPPIRTHPKHLDQTQDVYVALPPENGIPPVSREESSWGVPGSAFCKIFQMLPNDDGDPELYFIGKLAGEISFDAMGVEEEVFNVSQTRVPGRFNRGAEAWPNYVKVTRDKYGRWIADSPSTEYCGFIYTANGVDIAGPPDVGEIRWNNVLQPFATELIIGQHTTEDFQNDISDMYALFDGDTSGLIHLQQASNRQRWQLWHWTSYDVSTATFSVTRLASAGGFNDMEHLADVYVVFYPFGAGGGGATLPIDLTTDVTGTLPVGSGGTGETSLADLDAAIATLVGAIADGTYP